MALQIGLAGAATGANQAALVAADTVVAFEAAFVAAYAVTVAFAVAPTAARTPADITVAALDAAMRVDFHPAAAVVVVATAAGDTYTFRVGRSQAAAVTAATVVAVRRQEAGAPGRWSVDLVVAGKAMMSRLAIEAAAVVAKTKFNHQTRSQLATTNSMNFLLNT